MPFMNVPPTTELGEVSDGVIREGFVARETADLRNRYRPIYQYGQSRYVGGPQNSGDPEAKFEGGGSFATCKK